MRCANASGLRERARSQIREQLAKIAKAPQASIHIGLASPTKAVTECIDRLEPDLLVMGTVSRGGIAGLLLGNTAERLIDEVGCSLLALKPEGVICPVAIE